MWSINQPNKKVEVIMQKTWKPTVAGTMLMVIGISIPLLSLIVTLVYTLFYTSDQYGFFTLPFMFLAIWVLPLVSGIHASQRKKWRLVLTGSIAALCYIVPFTILSVNLIRDLMKYGESDFLPVTILFCSLLLITTLAIPTTVFIVVSKSEFE